MRLHSIALVFAAGILPMMAGADGHSKIQTIHSISIHPENRDYYDASKPCNEIYWDLRDRNEGNGYVSQTLFSVLYNPSYQHGFGGKIYGTVIYTDYCRKANLGGTCESGSDYWANRWGLLDGGDKVEMTWESNGCREVETYKNSPGEQNVVFESFNCNGSEYYTGTRTIHVCTALEQ